MRALICLSIALSASSVASAQSSIFGESHSVGAIPVDVIVRWDDRGGQAHGTVTIRSGTARREVHEGRPAYAWGGASDRGVMVAIVGATATVEARFVPVENGRLGATVSHSVPRLAGADRAPVGAAIATRPDGFALFWQEASTTNPQALYETYLARFDRDGRPTNAPVRVNAAWPIADVLWMPEGGQYYFLLYYGGDAAGTRLCGVHIGESTLTNVEHPYWVSRPGMIDEARLLADGRGRVHAVYRDDDHVYSSDVTSGSWGQNPAAAPTSHGRAASHVAFGARPRDTGIEVVLRPLHE